MLALYLAMIEEDGDKALFAELYGRYEKKLYSIAWNILGSPHLAEDAVHDTMVKIIRNFDKAKKIYAKSCADFECWIVIIVRNTARDILRGESHTVELEEEWDLPAPENVRTQSAYRALVDEIRNMPESYRAVLELRLVSEWSFDEIAKALGIKTNTARVRFQRGRAMLRERLEAMGYSYDGSGV